MKNDNINDNLEINIIKNDNIKNDNIKNDNIKNDNINDNIKIDDNLKNIIKNETIKLDDNLKNNIIITDNIKKNNYNIDDNILIWEDKFNKYNELEILCTTNINNILEIKNNLKNLLGHQDKDDMIFYKSIIDNSIFYLSNSLKIRKIKFLKDLNNIWQKINENKHMNELNKIYFQSLLKDYRKLAEEIMITKKNNIILNWVKDDKIENLQDFENYFTDIMKYHLKLIESLSACVELEKNFYCGK